MPSVRRLLPLLLALSCDSGSTESFEDCVVGLVPPAEGVAPGDTLVLGGGPFTVDWDTEVRLGGVPAIVLDVVREECLPCDACRNDAGCAACGACADCTTLCAPCVESVLVLVPDVAPGRQPVVMFNRHGGSSTVHVDVLPAEPVDTDTGDTDTDTDSDTDTDTDTDSDSDSDVITDTDTDTD